jgi:molybdenum cofactor cytidylyltransferase
MAEMISAVVLAAERAQRMGEQKIFLPLRGRPVLQWVLETALESDFREVVCVVRDLASVRHRIALAHERLFWLVNNAADRGQSTSIIAGLWATDPKSDGALFLAGDQPMVRRELIDALIERFESSSALIVAPTFLGQTRNPALFRRDLFPELLQLTGDRGGGALIEKYIDKTELVEWHDEAPFMDINVREDYERLNKLA